VVSQLKNAVGPFFDAEKLAAEGEAQGVDGAALNVALTSESPCAFLKELSPGLKLGECMKLAAAIKDSLQAVVRRLSEENISEVTRLKRKKYADKALRPWYWPYESFTRNAVIWVLGVIIIYCWVSEKLMVYTRYRKKAYKNKKMRKKKEKVEDDEGNEESHIDCQPSPDTMKNLVQLVKEANHKPSEDDDEGSSLRSRVKRNGEEN
jgi:hypothetical protein